MKRNRFGGRWGIGLISVLLLTAVLVTLAFTVASLSFSHLSVSNKIDNARVAQILAENAANLAVQKCINDNDWAATDDAKFDLKVEMDSAPGGWGKVSFSTAGQTTSRIPKSVNNILGEDEKAGSGRKVAAHCIHVIAYGRYQGVTKAIETIVGIPPWQYAIASNGDFQSAGGLNVTGVKNPGAAADGISQIPKDQESPGYTVSNAAGTNSTVLDANNDPLDSSRVTGDVVAGGSISLGSSTQVQGAVKPNSDPAKLPKIKVEDYNPSDRADCQTLNGYLNNGLIQGPAYNSGALSVTNGLKIDEGFLYVDGDLTVAGGLTGKGAIFCTGKVTISGMSNFGPKDVQAIVAKGDIQITGNGPSTSSYQGMVYTEGNFKASQLTVVGGVVSNNQGNVVKGVTLDHSNMIAAPEVVNTKFPVFGAMEPADVRLEMHHVNTYGAASAEYNTEHSHMFNMSGLTPAQQETERRNFLKEWGWTVRLTAQGMDSMKVAGQDRFEFSASKLNSGDYAHNFPLEFQPNGIAFDASGTKYKSPDYFTANELGQAVNSKAPFKANNGTEIAGGWNRWGKTVRFSSEAEPTVTTGIRTGLNQADSAYLAELASRTGTSKIDPELLKGLSPENVQCNSDQMSYSKLGFDGLSPTQRRFEMFLNSGNPLTFSFCEMAGNHGTQYPTPGGNHGAYDAADINTHYPVYNGISNILSHPLQSDVTLKFINPDGSVSTQTVTAGTTLQSLMDAYVKSYDSFYQYYHKEYMKQGYFCFDPNNFIQLSEKVRRILWHEIVADPNVR